MVGGEGVVARSRLAARRARPAATARRRCAARRAGSRRRSTAASIQRRLAEQRAGLGERGDHQRVPLGEHLVVEARPGAQLPRLEQRLAGRLDRRRPLPVAAATCRCGSGSTASSKLPAVGDVVELAHGRRRRRRARRRPRRASTCGTAPRGCGRRDRGSRRPRRRRTRRRAGAGRAARTRRSRRPTWRQRSVLVADRGVGVDADEQRLVVEHLLEVRHEPALVDRVAGEATADVVVDAAGRHRVERRRHGGEAAAASCSSATPPVEHLGEDQVERHRRRELRRRAEPTPVRVERADDGVDGGRDQRLLGRRRRRA